MSSSNLSGSPQVFTHPEHQLLVNITARHPGGLLARGLPPDSTLFLRVYASTAKGRSRSVTFEGYTLRMAEKQTGKGEQIGTNDWEPSINDVRTE